MSRAWRERGIRALLAAAALVSLLTVAAILGFLLYFGSPLLGGGNLARLFRWQWQPYQQQYGILPMIVGSLSLALTSLAIAYPLALGICGLAHGLAPRRVARGLLALIHFMASIPTVIYGLVSVFLLVPLIRRGFEGSSGFCLLAAAPTLAVLVLPTIVLLIHVPMQQVDPQLRLAARAMGLPPAAEFLRVVLPQCRRGLAAAAILGFGRAIGDTLISLMVAGNAARLPTSPLDSLRTLTAHIALVVSTDSQSVEYQSLFACGLILFAATAAVTFSARFLRRSRGSVRGHRSLARRGVGLAERISGIPLGSSAWQVAAEKACVAGCWLSGTAAAGLVATVVGFVALRGAPTLGVPLFFGETPAVDAILGRQPVFDGIWPAVVGTLQLVGVAAVLAIPLGVGSGIYVALYASPAVRRWLSATVDLLAGIPSIVMGLFGFSVILLLQRVPGLHARTCLLLSAACLALLVLPYLIRTTQSALESVPEAIRLTGPALGLHRSQEIGWVLLPAASRGILSGIVLAVGRIAEDTAVILLTGAVFFSGFVPHRLFDHFEALPYAIYYLHDRYENQAQLDQAFGAALTLLLLTSLIFASAHCLQRALHRRWMTTP